MFKIKNITVKNFLSIGNNTQAVDFEGTDLTLVLGHNLDQGGNGSRNGTGKSTILNALSYALYGDAITRIRVNNLINKTNGKNMLVTVDFSVNGTDYRIERGRRPNLLKLYVNGAHSDLDQGDQQGENRETQREIERIIGLPHTMFKHLIALNTYTEPFLGMRTSDQRAMIEQLLGITELSEKADILKERLKHTRDSIKEEEIRIAAVRSSNERIEKNIRDIENRAKAWYRTRDNKLSELEKAIASLEQIDIDQELLLHQENSRIREQQQIQQSAHNELHRAETSLKRCESNLLELNNNLKSTEDGVCYACGQDTAHLEDHEQYCDDLRKKIQEEQQYKTDLLNRITAAQKELEQLPDELTLQVTSYGSHEDALEHKHNLSTLMDQLTESRAEQNPYTEQAENLKQTGLQDICFDHMNSLTEMREHQEMLLQLLTSKDSFIRKKIIEQNLAYLNSRMAHYLDRVGLPHDVKFNSDLSVDITEFGRELDFFNLSRGEGNRLILSMSWAFRDIYESLNRPINLLFVDELIDSGMDSQGVENALAILKQMNRDNNRNIFLISHKEELVGRVQNVLYVIKSGGFTEYSNDVETV